MGKGNYDVDKRTASPDKLMADCNAGNNPPPNTAATPRMFFDKNGMLHIVLYGEKEIGDVRKHRLDKKGTKPDNEDKAYTDISAEGGDGGIYIHEYNSPPVDQVCPCKLYPIKDCPGSF